MRILAASLLILAVSLAGCTGTDTPPATPPDEEKPPVDPGDDEQPPKPDPVTEYQLLTDFEFTECTGIRFLHVGDTNAIGELLPDGYSPSSWPFTATVPVDQAQQGQLVVDLYQCERFTAGEFEFEDVWFGYVIVPVTAPEDAADASGHAYVLQMIAAEDVLAAVWPAAQYPTHAGPAGFEDLTVAQRATAGDYELDVTTTIPGTGGFNTDFAWYHELENGDRLTWTGTADVDGGNGGAASMTYPSDAPFASIAPVADQPLSGQGSHVTGGAFASMDLVQELVDYRE